MLIRTATFHDINAINNLFRQLDADAIRDQPEHFQRTERTDAYLLDIINADSSDFLIAVLDDEVIGFSLLYEKEVKGLSLLVPCKYVYLQDLIVDAVYRNRGIGKKLFEATKEWAEKRGLDYLRLSVLPTNKEAQRFYANNGMHEQMLTMECPLEK